MEEQTDSSDEEPGPQPRMPTDELMNSEVAILTGGRDQQGRQLITLPARHHGTLESKIKATGLGRILRYYMDSSRASDRKKGFGYVTDLRFAAIDFVSMLKSTLSSLQAEMRDTIGASVLYAIQPISKKTAKDTLTLLNLRKSKKKQNKHMTPPLFQVIIVVDEMDLYNYIDRSHLTPDLGGYLQYSHNAWLRFRKAVEPFFINYESLDARLPSGYERLINLSHQRAQGNSKEDLQQMLEWLRTQNEDIRSDINIEPVSDLCDSLQNRFARSENDPVFGPMAQKPIFRETRSMLSHCHCQLTLAERKLDALWEGASVKIQQTIDLMSYTEQVKQLQDWFAQKGWKELKRKVEIADSVSKAEMLRNHFDTGLHSKAKAKLAQTDGLIQHAETMVLQESNENIVGIMNASKQLKQQTLEFRTALSKRNALLQMVYDFFYVYEKAAKWVTRVLKFLPDNLIDLFSDLQSQKRKERSRSIENEWREDVKRFLSRYPPPKREELAKGRKAAEAVPENKAKKQGRVLVHRCLVLLRILNLKEIASMKDVLEAVKWQDSLLSAADNTDASGSQIRQRRRAPSPDSSYTSREADDVSRSRQPRSGAKARDEKLEKVDETGRRSARKRNDPSLKGHDEIDTPITNKPYRAQPVRDLYTEGTPSRSQTSPGFIQRSMYLPGGTGREVHTVPLQATPPSHDRLNVVAPTPQELHNKSFGIYGESGADSFGYSNGMQLYPIGDIPQGLPAHHLPGNRYPSNGLPSNQKFSLYPPAMPGRPSTSSPNSEALSPPTTSQLSGDPSPIRRAQDMSMLNSTQQSPPLRPYKSMYDVRHQPVGTDAETFTNYPLNTEASHLHGSVDQSRVGVGVDGAWGHPRLQHGKSEPSLTQPRTVTSPYNDLLDNLSSLRIQSSDTPHHDALINHTPVHLDEYSMPPDQTNPQSQYYQRLFGSDSPNIGQLSSDNFHDRSPYDFSVVPQRQLQNHQQRRTGVRQKQSSKLPLTDSLSVAHDRVPQLDRAEALTSLDILEYELAADREYLAEEIADDKYRMEKEHQAMIDSILNRVDEEPQEHLSRHYDIDDLATNYRANSRQQSRRPTADSRHGTGMSTRNAHLPKPSSDPSEHAMSPRSGTPPLPEILTSPPNEDWNLYDPPGAHGGHPISPLTMDELDLDDTSPRLGHYSSVANGQGLAPLTDRLKEYFESGEPSEPIEYERMLETAQRNREESQEVLRQEMDRYNDLLMHQENLVHQDLQDRLYKIEEKLQEEESIIKQEAELDYLMEIERRRDYTLHKPSSHNHFDMRRDINLQLSDEGVIFDGGSIDEGYEHASTITTERESVESGLGLRRSRSNGSHNASVIREKPENHGASTALSGMPRQNGVPPRHLTLNGIQA